MTANAFPMVVDGIAVEVARKRIKHLHLKVHRIDGRVRVSAPLGMTEAMIRAAVAARIDWIRQKRQCAEESRPASVREFVTGERHHFQGRACRLEVVEQPGRPRVDLRGDRVLAMRVRPGADASRRQAVLEDWYRAQLRSVVPDLIRRWEPALGVEVAEWRIKRMRTRWGSCNTAARRIWLNLALAQRTPACLEYVLVHEMVHLLERGHNARFYGYLDRFLPGWRSRSEALRRAA